ncbi:MAG: helix-turn-helix domain-containing protein [Solirubrobacteraceae bacterium]
MRTDQNTADRPWERLDRALAAALEPELPGLADEVIAAIGRAVPEYRRSLDGAFGRGLRAGVRRSLQQFVDLIGRPGEVSAASREVYRDLGRGEQRAGRTLDALQAAYRLGARLSWRRLSAVARRQGADAGTVSLLAESIFAYIEEVSASSVEGYAQAQAELAGERERRRRRLVRLLLEGEMDAEEIDLRAAAIEAGWQLPARLHVLACEQPDAARLSTMIGPEAIGARLEELTCVLIPDRGADAREQIAAALRRAAPSQQPEVQHPDAWHAALGPSVPAAEARLSFTRASEALKLQRLGVLPSGRLVLASKHLLTLLLHRDLGLTTELAEQRLAPLSELAPRSRQRLELTLLAWLRNGGNVPATAAELHVHRQTVRYRLTRLRELLGSDLDDPDRRLEIELALRGRLGG